MTANFSPLRPVLALLAVLAILLCVGVTAATAAPVPSDAARQEARDAGDDLRGILKQKPIAKLNVPKKFRKALRRSIPRAESFALKTITVPFKADRKRKKKKAKAAGVAVERMTIDGGTKAIDGGTVTMTSQLRRDANGDVEADLELRVEKGGETLLVRPDLNRMGQSKKEVECPTAEGRLTDSDSFADGNTVIHKRGGRVIRAITERERADYSSTGQVGRDALLASVETKVTLKLEHYTRGVQLVTTASGTAVAQREGNPSVAGDVAVDVNLKAAGYSSAEAKKVADKYGAANKAGLSENLAGYAKSARYSFLNAEYKWYQVPNYCASADFDPNWERLDKGESMAVKGTVRSQRWGGEAAGSFGQPNVGKGSFAMTKAEIDPGSPAEFTAVGGDPGSGTATVRAEAIASSTAGRAIVGFEADREDISLPTTFGGWIEAETISPGMRHFFDAMFDFKRTGISYGPNGFVQAWYELDHIDVINNSLNAIGFGCRWEAEASSGAVVNSGDIELIRASTNAPWTYAIQVDFSIPDQLFGLKDCPPDSGMEAFTGDIVNTLYTAPNGQAYREIWSGSTATDMRLIENGVGDVAGPAGYPTVATWGLIGTFN